MLFNLRVEGHLLGGPRPARLVARDDGVSDAFSDQSDAADRVIVGRDRVVDAGRVTVRVNDGDDRNTEPFRFCDGDIFLADVDDKHHLGERGHLLDAAQELVQADNLGGRFLRLTLGRCLEGSVRDLLFKTHEVFDPLLDRLEVRQHPAKPALVYVQGAGASADVRDRFLRLLFGAYEHHLTAVSDRLLDERRSGLKFFHRLGEVEDVDLVSGRKNVRLHLRVPALGRVAEVGAGFKQPAQRNWRALFRLSLCSRHRWVLTTPRWAVLT